MSSPNIVNVADAEEIMALSGDHWGQGYKVLTPAMEAAGRHLGANLTRVPKGRIACPFHYHQREDEIFYVVSGRGVLRYGDDLTAIKAGDCISCPGGKGIAHQIANPYDEDLVYLAVGPNDPDEVCVYPDSGKVYVRSLKRIGLLENVDYMAGEPERPRILDLAVAAGMTEPMP